MKEETYTILECVEEEIMTRSHCANYSHDDHIVENKFMLSTQCFFIKIDNTGFKIIRAAYGRELKITDDYKKTIWDGILERGEELFFANSIEEVKKEANRYIDNLDDIHNKISCGIYIKKEDDLLGYLYNIILRNY